MDRIRAALSEKKVITAGIVVSVYFDYFIAVIIIAGIGFNFLF